MIILAANIPEVSTLLQNHMIQVKPYIAVARDSLSNAIIPITGFISTVPHVDTTTSYALTHGQSLTAPQIDAILSDIQSPAIHTGSIWYSLGEDKAIDAAYLLAIFMHESSAATNQQWVGIKSSGHTYNVGNMRCAMYDPNRDGILDCYNGFRDYSSYATERERWYAGIEDNFNNLVYYRDSLGIKDFNTALLTWAPPSENNTTAYIKAAHVLIDGWRAVNDAAQSAKSVSAPITTDRNTDFGFNVSSALDINKGALRKVVILSGDTWSFNETLGKPNTFPPLKTIFGVEGGGWCDLACRYIQAAKGLGLHTEYLQHGGIALNSCSLEDSPFIWTVDGVRGLDKGRQDLLITNNTVYTAVIEVIEKDNAAIIIGNLK